MFQICCTKLRFQQNPLLIGRNLAILNYEVHGLMAQNPRKNRLTGMPSNERPKQRGQSFVELALMMPVLILLIAGMVEVVFTFNDFLQMLDGVRYGARYVSDLNPYPTDGSSPGRYDNFPSECTTITASQQSENFFRSTACKVVLGLRPITLTRGTLSRSKVGNTCVSPATPQDDIVISIFATTVENNVVSIVRYDNNNFNNSNTPTNQLVVDDASSVDGADSGWSYMKDGVDQSYNSVSGTYSAPNSGTGGMCSKFTTAQVSPLLVNSAPNTGIVLVEVFHNRPQMFNLPVFNEIIPNPVPLWSYAFFPLTAAEPTSTPVP